MRGSLALRFLGMAISTLVVGSSLVACEGETTKPTTTGGSTEESNGESYADAICGRIFDCCNISELAEHFGNSNVVDYAGCRILYRTLWEAAIEPNVAAGEQAGRLSFSQANFDTCMQSIGNLSCADFKTAPTLCENVFTPKVAAGQACFFDPECIDGDCDFSNNPSAGTCIADPTPAGMGGACTKNEGCESGLYCDNSMCVTKKADGEMCLSDDECKSGTCTSGPMGKCATICEGGGPGRGPIDKTLESVGAPFIIAQCNKAFECCSGDEFGGVIFPGISAKSQCLTFYGAFLSLGLVSLHNDSVAGKLTIDAAAFQACIDRYNALSCQDVALGDTIDCPEAAKGLIADGAACTEDAQCVSKYCNETMPDQGTCATLPGAGAPCTTDCVDGFYCNAGMCAAQKALGSACTKKDECLEGRCYGEPGMQTCALICDGI